MTEFITELLDLTRTARWRAGQAQRFADQRNATASRRLRVLALGVEALNGSELHRRLVAVAKRHPRAFRDTASAVLRSIGLPTRRRQGFRA